MKLTFKKASTPEEIKEVFDFNIQAFSDTPDFNWTLAEIYEELKDHWELYGVHLGPEVIAALLVKEEAMVDKNKEVKALLSKNTAIKIEHQGNGYSHKIKEFLESEAKKRQVKAIYHYCRIDNFRMYSLNEGHNYKKTDRKLGADGLIVEWVKSLA